MVETIGGIVLVILFIEFGLSVYFLVIVAKFDKKLASEMNYAQRKGMVLEPLRTKETIQLPIDVRRKLCN